MADTSNNTLTDNTEEIAAKLIDGLFNDELSDDMKRRLQGWFKSSVSEEQKYRALQDIINNLKENTRPDEYDERRLELLHQILGLPQANHSVPGASVESTVAIM